MRDHKYAGVAPACYGIRRPMKLEYTVIVPDEPGAGIRGFTDDITVEIANGSPDWETIQSATEHFKQAISEWYDMGRVWTKEELKAIRIEQE